MTTRRHFAQTLGCATALAALHPFAALANALRR